MTSKKGKKRSTETVPQSGPEKKTKHFSWDNTSYAKNIERLFLFLPYFLILSYVCLLIDLVTYPGFIKKYLFIDSAVPFVIAVTGFFFEAWWKLHNFKTEKDSFTTFLLYCNRALTIPLLLSNYILNNLEKEHYTNYVFATFHLNLSRLESLVTLNIFLLVVDLIFSHQEIREILRTKMISAIQVVFFVSVIYVFIPQFTNASQLIAGGTSDMLANPFKSNDQKFVEQMNGNNTTGWIFTYTQFLNRKVPKNGKIFIPPQIEPWLMEGNQYYVRWFLYPRDVIYERDPNAPIPLEAEYIMIAHGIWY